jgi:hypothetical protein
MTLSNKALDVRSFEVHIVLPGRRSHLHFLDHADGVFLGVVRFLLLRVAVLVEVGDAAHGRISRRRDFDQVQAAALRNFDRLAQRQDSDLAAVGVDDTDLLRANQVIDANRGLP